MAVLADQTGATEAEIRAWEEGSSPLALAAPSDVDRLKAGLTAADASHQLVADVTTAACCDLIALLISLRDTITSLMAHPMADETAFAELLAWSVIGQVPSRYQALYDVTNGRPHR